ncbi:MAG: hypothetical protein WC631_01705 [Candidatus Paceibacterota bacterium]|jgi:hypothetical protein
MIFENGYRYPLAKKPLVNLEEKMDKMLKMMLFFVLGSVLSFWGFHIVFEESMHYAFFETIVIGMFILANDSITKKATVDRESSRALYYSLWLVFITTMVPLRIGVYCGIIDNASAFVFKIVP